jgi:hypothetical protein
MCECGRQLGGGTAGFWSRRSYGDELQQRTTTAGQTIKDDGQEKGHGGLAGGTMTPEEAWRRRAREGNRRPEWEQQQQTVVPLMMV